MQIIKVRDKYNIDIKFLDEYQYIKKHNLYANFKNGCIKNPYDKSVFGVGCLGVGKYVTKTDGKTDHKYFVWSSMLDRCYHNQNRHPTYYGKCTVCNEWLNYQVFAKWYEEHDYEVKGRLHLDKDILCVGNMEYSPDKCCLVPQRINMLFTNKPNKRGLPNGITKTPNGYCAKYNSDIIGEFTTLVEAYQNYAITKENKIKEVAKEYREIIPQYIYNALLKYKVNISSDKNYSNCNYQTNDREIKTSDEVLITNY